MTEPHFPQPRLVTSRHLTLVAPASDDGPTPSVPLTLSDLASAVMITVNGVGRDEPNTSGPREFVWVLARGTNSAICELMGIRITVTAAAAACFAVQPAQHGKGSIPTLSPPRLALVDQEHVSAEGLPSQPGIQPREDGPYVVLPRARRRQGEVVHAARDGVDRDVSPQVLGPPPGVADVEHDVGA